MNHLALVRAADDPGVLAEIVTMGADVRPMIAALQVAQRGNDATTIRSAIRVVGAERTRLIARLEAGEAWFRQATPTTDAQRRQVAVQEARWIALLRCYQSCEDAIADATPSVDQLRLAA